MESHVSVLTLHILIHAAADYYGYGDTVASGFLLSYSYDNATQYGSATATATVQRYDTVRSMISIISTISRTFWPGGAAYMIVVI